MSMSPKEAFHSAYALHLAKARQEKPDIYVWPVEELPAIVEKMMLALARGGANIDSPAIKAACKMVRIKPGIARIKMFLACDTWEAALPLQN